jgi:EF hand domain-containing protein
VGHAAIMHGRQRSGKLHDDRRELTRIMGFAADRNLTLPIGLQKIIMPGQGVPSLEAAHLQIVPNLPGLLEERLKGGFAMDRPAFMRHPTPAAPKGASRRQLLLLGLASCMATAAFARGGGRAGSFAGIDRDGDGTIDLDEAKRAAGALFQHLDRRNTGRLSRAQIGRLRISLAEFSWADRDHDGTLDKDEFLALVERQFRAADVDHDGTVSRAEFASRTGLPLRRLVY